MSSVSDSRPESFYYSRIFTSGVALTLTGDQTRLDRCGVRKYYMQKSVWPLYSKYGFACFEYSNCTFLVDVNSFLNVFGKRSMLVEYLYAMTRFLESRDKIHPSHLERCDVTFSTVVDGFKFGSNLEFSSKWEIEMNSWNFTKKNLKNRTEIARSDMDVIMKIKTSGKVPLGLHISGVDPAGMEVIETDFCIPSDKFLQFVLSDKMTEAVEEASKFVRSVEA